MDFLQVFRMKSSLFYLILSSTVLFSQQASDFRLPNNSKPINYNLIIEPYLQKNGFYAEEELLFNGQTKILLEILTPTPNLTLHSSSELTIKEEKTQLVLGEKVFTPVRHISLYEPEFLILQFSENLQPGIYNLSLEYSGRASYDPNGILYVDVPNNEEKERAYVIVTDFKPIFARSVFPCWDEPAFKATFDISIRHLANYTALSNMPAEEVIDTSKVDGKKLTSFKRTPPMSTYSVSFAITPFENISIEQKSINIWAKKALADNLNANRGEILNIFSFWEKHTNITYPLTKLDMVVLPDHISVPWFTHGNSGLNLLSSPYILYMDKNNTIGDPASLQVSEITILNSIIVDAWLENQVSPNWWEDVWFTESINVYLQFILFSKAVNSPAYMDENLSIAHSESLEHNFRSNVTFGPAIRNKWDIRGLTRIKVVSKGMGVIQMLRGLISEDVFNAGLKELLEEHKSRTISTDDIWKAMQESLNQSQVPYFDIKEKMDPYLLQVGFPMVNVERNYKTGEIKLTQECVYHNTSFNSKWWIPINYATSSSFNFSSTQATLWMNPNEKETIIRGVDPNDLVIFNIQETASYVVNYDKESWMKLAHYLNSSDFTKVPTSNRAKLLLDASWAYRLGKMDKDLLHTLFSYLSKERDITPWICVFRIIRNLPAEVEALIEMSETKTDVQARYEKEYSEILEKVLMNV